MVVDRKSALEILDGDEELFAEICELFRTEGVDTLRCMREAADTGAIAAATRYAHSLKSISLNIGAVNLSDMARRAERTGHDGDLALFRDQIPQLEEELERVMARL